MRRTYRPSIIAEDNARERDIRYAPATPSGGPFCIAPWCAEPGVHPWHARATYTGACLRHRVAVRLDDWGWCPECKRTDR